MTAITRWVEYDVASTSTAGLGGTGGKGTPGKSIGTGTLGANQAQLDYKVDIGSSNKRLTLGIDGYAAPYIELASGTGLDPRFIAKNITEELHRISPLEPRWANARCVWENNHLVIYSGRLGAGSYVTVTSGTNSAHIDLGWDTKSRA